MRAFAKLSAVILSILILPSLATPCTTAGYTRGGKDYFAQNYDWMVPDALVVVNRRGVAKMGLDVKNPARWVSKYGSVTFDQYGIDLPIGGMNEAGLAYGIMWLEGTQYEPVDERPELSVLQWAQYQLDTCASVAEIRERLRDVRVGGGRATAPVHYHFSDANGESAIVEFLDGKLIFHSGGELPARVLSNNPYEACATRMQEFAPFGGTATVPDDIGSISRFLRAASALEDKGSKADGVAEGFGILDSVRQDGLTKWSIVYENDARRVSFRTEAAPEVRTLDFAGLDFSCEKPMQILDMNAPFAGDIAPKLRPYSREVHRALLAASFSKTDFLAHQPAEFLDALAAAPELFRCQ